MPDDIPQPPVSDESLAKQRFATLGALRFGGVAIAIVGLLLLGEKLSVIGPAIDRILGGACVILGIFAVLLVPTLIARHWNRSGKR